MTRHAQNTTPARACPGLPRPGLLQILGASSRLIRAHGAEVSHPLCMRKALGSIPGGSIWFSGVGRRAIQMLLSRRHDSLAEWSKALAQGASPQGRGFETHSCHFAARGLLGMREARGSIRSVSTFCRRSCLLIALQSCRARGRHSVCK